MKAVDVVEDEGQGDEDHHEREGGGHVLEEVMSTEC